MIRTKVRRLILLVALLITTLVAAARAGDPDQEVRALIERTLIRLGQRGQHYYHMNIRDNGGQGSFASISLQQLTNTPSNGYCHYVLSAPNASSITLTGWCDIIGYDGATPIEVEAIVYADSMMVTIVN